MVTTTQKVASPFLRATSLRIPVIVLLCAATIAATFILRPHGKPPPIEVSLWYWHSPFQIPPGELAELKTMGVRRLFVRAGVVRKGAMGVRLTLPQEWKTSAPGIDVHLVFNFGYDVVGAFANIPNNTLSATLWEMADRERKRASDHGVTVAGIQMDLDCPTSKLPKYAELLHLLHDRAAAQRLMFSATALPTWLTSAAVKNVAASVDFLVPQFYEAVMPKTRQAFVGISSLTRFERGLEAAGRLGVPFYAGAPSYGHALVYDDQDRLLGLFHDMGPDDAMRANGFHLERSFGMNAKGDPAAEKDYLGEDAVEFRAPPMEGDKPYRLLYDLPTPVLVAQHLRVLRESRPANCLGMILFRYPERGERETVPLTGLQAALTSRSSEPDMTVKLSVSSAPWEIIETARNAARPPLEIRAFARNTGPATTFFATDSVVLTLILDRSGIEDMPPPSHGFDSVDCYSADRPGELNKDKPAAGLLPSSPSRANVLVFRKSCLAPGEALSTGPIRLRADSAAHVRGFWTARCAGGLRTLNGSVKETDLTTLVEASKHDISAPPGKDGSSSHAP